MPGEIQTAATEFREAVEHLNRVVAMMVPLEFDVTEDAALFLLRAHRTHGTQIRQSIFDCAVALEKEMIDMGHAPGAGP